MAPMPFYVAGRAVLSDDVREICSPYDDSLVGTYTVPAAADIERAVAAADTVTRASRTLSAATRAAALDHVSRRLAERSDEIAQLISAENGKPIIAKLHRCVEGKAGERLLADQRALRARLTNDRRMVITPEARSTAALVEARRLGFVDDEIDPTRSEL